MDLRTVRLLASARRAGSYPLPTPTGRSLAPADSPPQVPSTAPQGTDPALTLR